MKKFIGAIVDATALTAGVILTVNGWSDKNVVQFAIGFILILLIMFGTQTCIDDK